MEKKQNRPKKAGQAGWRETIDLKMKEKNKVLKWTQLEIRIHPESFCCGKTDKAKWLSHM